MMKSRGFNPPSSAASGADTPIITPEARAPMPRAFRSGRRMGIKKYFVSKGLTSSRRLVQAMVDDG